MAVDSGVKISAGVAHLRTRASPGSVVMLRASTAQEPTASKSTERAV